MPGATQEIRNTRDVTGNKWEPSSWVSLVRPFTPRTRVVILSEQYARSLSSGSVQVKSPVAPAEDEWSDGDNMNSDTDLETAVEPVDAEEVALVTAIESIIAELRGAVCPKVGDKCASDAGWATFRGNSRCETASEILTLIQASERTTAVLGDARGSVSLALRQWANMDPRMEFRAFVDAGVVVGLCSRSPGRGTLADNHMDRVTEECSTWIQDSVHARVVDLFGPRYVVDCFVDTSWKPWIVDFAPWGPPTDPLLFRWDELDLRPWMAAVGRAQFRARDDGGSIRPADGIYHGVPLELRNANSGAALAEAAREMYQREMQSQQEN